MQSTTKRATAIIALCSLFAQPALADSVTNFSRDLKAYLHFNKKDLWINSYYRGDDGLANGTFYVRFRDRTNGRAGAKAHDKAYGKVMKLVCDNGIKERSINLGVPIVLMIVNHRKDIPQQTTPIRMADCPQ